MHFGWACDMGGSAALVEAKWHLDGWTLHLDALAQRCFDAGAPPPGKTFVWDATQQLSLDGFKADVSFVPDAAAQSERPHVAAVDHAAAVDAWRQAGVAHPYMSSVAADAHAVANVEAVSHRGRRDSDNNCWDTCTDCTDDWWWVWVVFGAFLLFFFVFVVVLIFWCNPELYEFPHPHHPDKTHVYESPAHYRALHGHDPLHARQE
jgi:hypothetical protein